MEDLKNQKDLKECEDMLAESLRADSYMESKYMKCHNRIKKLHEKDPKISKDLTVAMEDETFNANITSYEIALTGEITRIVQELSAINSRSMSIVLSAQVTVEVPKTLEEFYKLTQTLEFCNTAHRVFTVFYRDTIHKAMSMITDKESEACQSMIKRMNLYSIFLIDIHLLLENIYDILKNITEPDETDFLCTYYKERNKELEKFRAIANTILEDPELSKKLFEAMKQNESTK